MTHTNDLCSTLRQPVDRRQRSTNAKIIGDDAGIIRAAHRHVEVGTKQNVATPYVTEVFQKRKFHGRILGRYFATIEPI
jgi:hypothetical protein